MLELTAGEIIATLEMVAGAVGFTVGLYSGTLPRTPRLSWRLETGTIYRGKTRTITLNRGCTGSILRKMAQATLGKAA